MSRSFYVDSLIVKDVPTTAVSKSDCVPNHSVGMPLPLGHRHSTPTPRLSQSLPCYPRHPQDMLSFCCPLCVHTPHPVVPESVASVPGMAPSFTTSCPTTRAMVEYPFHRGQASVLTTKSAKRPKERVNSSNLHEQKKPKASPVGKNSTIQNQLSYYLLVNFNWKFCCFIQKKEKKSNILVAIFHYNILKG